MPLESLPVDFLFRMDGELTTPVTVAGAPQGTRMILGVTGGRVEGPKLNGNLVAGPGSEWATLRADNSLKVDVRLMIESDDGAHILMTYNGVGVPDKETGLAIRTCPLFETGDERYDWLTRIQAIGIGHPGGRGVVYDVYALR